MEPVRTWFGHGIHLNLGKEREMRILYRACVTAALFFACAGPAAASLARASWYGPGFEQRRMADGKRFSSADPTIAAHRTLPFGTRLRLTNPLSGRSIVVIIQDRGPYVRNRSLDLSRAAAACLGFVRQGTALLDVEILGAPRGEPAV